ncbi:hypothetical protein TNCT_694491 [Trichonephila clavata]|uniref:Uncharacterized protein n=1 Tax=Trichonephila clavata TaxID=2740835 RepID=A0A8X6KG37_TRICU|nr:hypothetical protein TNCT_694491 [Trichonephila clavata]
MSGTYGSYCNILSYHSTPPSAKRASEKRSLMQLSLAIQPRCMWHYMTFFIILRKVLTNVDALVPSEPQLQLYQNFWIAVSSPVEFYVEHRRHLQIV